MAYGKFRGLLFQIFFSIVAGTIVGGSLGLAFAQDRNTGSLNIDCVARCTANGYDAEFCGQVCWVPDPAKSVEADQLDWKCMTDCGDRGGRARACAVSCRRY